MEKHIKNILEKAVAEKVFPGATVGVIDSGVRRSISAGHFTYEDASPAVLDDTAYDTASITKTIPVALIALLFIEQGLLSLDEKVITYLPEVTTPGADAALVRHLLTYSYVLKKTEGFSFEHATAQGLLDYFLTREFEFVPGTKHQYSNAPLVILGMVLERVSGERLYDLADRLVFKPLKMHDSTFFPKNKLAIPPTEVVSWRGVVQGVVHDETACILQREGYEPGCAGLFSTTGDILNVVEMVLNNGVFGGKNIFDPHTIELMETNALESIGAWSGVGWELNTPRFMGDYSHEHMIGKTGYTGTCCVIDPRSKKAFVMFSNMAFPKRPQNTDALNAVRREVANVVFSV